MQGFNLSIGILMATFLVGGWTNWGFTEDNPKPLVKLPIGMNLAGIRDYIDGYPFKNLMWGARPWLSKNIDGSGPFNTNLSDKFEYDENGYPLEVPLTVPGASQPQILFTIIPNRTEPGRYVLLYEGEGEITGAMGTEVVESRPGRIVLKLINNERIRYEGITIKRSIRGNHIRNIRILREEEEHADLKVNPFREDFLEYCRQWHAIRFMDWGSINNSAEKEWDTRKKPTFYTMVGYQGDAIGRWGKAPSKFELMFSGGVALEIMIQLVNMIKVDPWFCIPHRATPDYVVNYAKMVKERLDPSLKIYVEYSNEIWNWSFQQAHWMLHSRYAGEILKRENWNAWSKEPEFVLDDGEVAKDGGKDHPERSAVLMRRCFEGWEQVFAGEDRKRLIRVIGVQHSWLDTAQRTVKWVVKLGGADAVASAGYFGPNAKIYQRWEKAGASLTADQVIQDMWEALETDSIPWTRSQANLAKQYQLKFLVYEGGQHIQPENQAEKPYMPALKDAQYHPGMYQLYLRNFQVHQEVGCELFMAFSSVGKQGTRWGSWGHQEYYGQSPENMPKLKALRDVNLPKSR